MLSSSLPSYERCFCTVDTKPLNACLTCMLNVAHAFRFVENKTARMCMFAECVKRPPCPFCMGNTTGPGKLYKDIRLTAFYRCPHHMSKVTQEAVCSCGLLWADCRDCKGLDPRAGKDFCGFCGQERSSCTHQQQLHDGLRIAKQLKSTEVQKRQVCNFPFLMERLAVHTEVAVRKYRSKEPLSAAELLLVADHADLEGAPQSVPLPKLLLPPMTIVHPSQNKKAGKFPRMKLESIQEEGEEETEEAPPCEKAVPSKRAASPRKRAVSPRKRAVSPRKKAVQLPKQPAAPKKSTHPRKKAKMSVAEDKGDTLLSMLNHTPLLALEASKEVA